ncbi:NADPH-dependent L-lysine N(6)-monooxygenase MbtG [Streptomyces chumphonensis]|uniref:L-lysine N6-monooxygenase MbtG n=1 Tax=Streptomyces chumphonensis TaxID=1214925 RepID=A0A927F005_9ACTN|nr:SidA/IucD/PvdA family monooxygenase [Streptomyces chumphonensis]MBD3933115.1 SidA/IucD/PvdA family monooxygenase [Streptomyces chumphonensis]
MEPLSPQEAQRRFGVPGPVTSGLLCVVGAGPKALATAAKSQVLREMGFDAPRVVIVEPYGVGANWTAVGGRTNGKPRLSTSPEKDLGFPYARAGYGALSGEVNSRVQEFGWTGFLVATGRYAAWVDAGRPSPRHSTWAAYLRWAAGRLDVPVVGGWVRRMEVAGDHWEVTVEGSRGGEARIGAGAVMVSGPGPRDGVLAGDAVCSVEEYWRLGLDTSLTEPSVAVVGGGETAASIVENLVLENAGTTTVISPQPVVYSRGEGYFENALYSEPERWLELSDVDRREVIARTDRAVYSPRAIETIASEGCPVSHRQGRVVSAHRVDGRVELVLRNPDRADLALRFDVVIDATGARHDWFLDLLGPQARQAVRTVIGDSADTTEALEHHIGADLSLVGLRPRLVLPTLAGYAQGPGFANLSSLGLLADRVLGVTVPASVPTAGPSTDPTTADPDGAPTSAAAPIVADRLTVRAVRKDDEIA